MYISTLLPFWYAVISHWFSGLRFSDEPISVSFCRPSGLCKIEMRIFQLIIRFSITSIYRTSNNTLFSADMSILIGVNCAIIHWYSQRPLQAMQSKIERWLHPIEWIENKLAKIQIYDKQQWWMWNWKVWKNTHLLLQSLEKEPINWFFLSNSIQTRIYELTQRIMAHLISFIQPSNQ